MQEMKWSFREAETNVKKCCYSILLAALCVGIMSCDDDYMDSIELSGTPHDIVNGTALSDADAENSGIVWTGGCTGTVLNAHWILVAAHCYPASADANNDGVIDDPTLYTIRFGHATDLNAETRTPARIMKHPNGIWGSGGGTDAALIEIASMPDFFPPSGHFTFDDYYNSGGRMLIFNGGDEGLVGATVKTMGYGKVEPLYGAPYTSAGILREGEAVVNSVSNATVNIRSDNAPDGLLCNGDSGGPTFLDVQGNGGLIARYLVGISSTSDCQTYSSITRPDRFRDWVESTVFSTDSSSISCQTWGCSSAPNPLPNNTFAYQAYSPSGAAANACFYASADFGFEQGWDYLTIGNQELTGSGTYGTHWCGELPISYKTDSSVPSGGLYWMSFSQLTTNVAPPSYQCEGVYNGWVGCRGTGCHACVELLEEYPKYFTNHPNCVPNATCDGSHYLCSANCPAPTSADQ